MRMLLGVAVALAISASAYAQDKTWTGVISDSMCGLKHADGNRACTEACVKKGADFVFVSDGKVFKLVDRDKLVTAHAGHKVELTGTMKDDTITVSKVAMTK